MTSIIANLLNLTTFLIAVYFTRINFSALFVYERKILFFIFSYTSRVEFIIICLRTENWKRVFSYASNVPRSITRIPQTKRIFFEFVANILLLIDFFFFLGFEIFENSG